MDFCICGETGDLRVGLGEEGFKLEPPVWQHLHEHGSLHRVGVGHVLPIAGTAELAPDK